MIHSDFETRSRVDIWEVGAWAYSVHPSTEILCLAFTLDEHDISLIHEFEIEPGVTDTTAAWFKFNIDRGELFGAFNSFFEYCIWHNILVKKFGWPRIPIKQWRCSMAKSLAYAHPQSLDKVTEALGSMHQKSRAGHTMMLKLSKPNNRGEWNEDPEDLEVLYQYCIDDVAAEREVDKLLPDLISQEQTYWFLDQLINQRGISIDTAAVSKALVYIKKYTSNLNGIVFEESGFVLDRVTRRQAVLDWCKSQGVDVPGYTKGDVKSTLEQELPENVRTVLEAKLELGKTSVAKYQALSNSVGEDQRIRDTLIYHGATTGRWTGKLFQLQNLPRGSVSDTEICIKMLKEQDLSTFEIFYPDVMGALSSCIRGMIIASEGCELFVGDYNAIEARVLFWLCEEEYGLKQFANGEPIYEDMAQRIYSVDKVSKTQRDLGKRAVLGCGYGMGAPKFVATCLTQAQIVIPLDLAQRAVTTYRSTYACVVRSWYAQESAAIQCVTSKQDVICGRIRWHLDSRGTLLCRLPSGRDLAYPKAFLEYKNTPWGERKLALHFYAVDSKTKRWVVEDTYGGKIIENITQGIARDLLANAMLRCESQGWPVIFSVHDEIVADTPAGTKTLDAFERCLCALPGWAIGCPIKVEGFITKRYRK